MSRSGEFHEQTPHVASYDKYLIEDTGSNLVWARIYDPQKPDALGKRVGSMSWFGGKTDLNDTSNISGGKIHKVYVSSQFRRKGIASAMLDFARERYPEKKIRHSSALSPEGAAWSQAKP